MTSDLKALTSRFGKNDADVCGLRLCRWEYKRLVTARGFACFSPLGLAKILSCRQQKPRSRLFEGERGLPDVAGAHGSAGRRRIRLRV